MAWMWARIYTRSLRLGIYKGGFQAFLDLMAQQIVENGAIINLESPVERIQIVDGKPALTVKGERHIFDRVISTTSPKLLLQMTEG
jgi:phytoene dehydrogenase-like protein